MMPAGRIFKDLRARFSRSALLFSASALSLCPVSGAHAGPLDNTSFVSMYGGFIMQDSDTVLELADDTSPPIVSPDLEAGDNGGAFGLEFGRPISELMDIRVAVSGIVLSENEIDYVSPAPSNEPVSAWSRFSYQHLDLELGYRPGVLGNNLRVFAGPRVLHASSDVDQSKSGTFENDVDLWGAGIRAGAQAELPVSERFSFSLMGAGSALAAHSDSDASSSSSSVSESDEEWRAVYEAEAVAALNVDLSERTSVQLGYQVQQGWNLTSVVELAGAPEVNGGDLLTHGPVARITVKLP